MRLIFQLYAGCWLVMLLWIAGAWYEQTKEAELNRELKYWICGQKLTAFTECEKVHAE